jgi:hypothetical protein
MSGLIAMGALRNEVVLGMIQLYLVTGLIAKVILALGPKTFVGKLAHFCRVYRIMTCYSLIQERNCERHMERNYAKVLTTREG